MVRSIKTARMGHDVVFGNNVEIKRPLLVTIGDHVAIDTGVYITTGATIWNYVHISPYVTVIGGENAHLTMGNFTNLAAGCRVICGSDLFSGAGLIGPASLPDEFKDIMNVAPVVIEDFANIGTNAVIMPGVTIGQGSVIGACALVTRSTPPWSVCTGIPAKPYKARPWQQMVQYARQMGYEVIAKQ